MTYRRRKPKSPSFIQQNLVLILLGMVALLLVLSVVYSRDPYSLMQDAYYAMSADSASVGKSIPAYRREIDIMQFHLDSLREIAEQYDILTSVQVVRFRDSEGFINLRSLPDIDSEVILKIPAIDPIELIYLEQETQYLLGEYGHWAKTRYKNREGWIWSGLLILDEDL